MTNLRRVTTTNDEIQTFICEIKNIVSTRPLTHLSKENFDELLNSYHLIHGINLVNTNHY